MTRLTGPVWSMAEHLSPLLAKPSTRPADMGGEKIWQGDQISPLFYEDAQDAQQLIDHLA